MVSDVALLPLSSQKDVSISIREILNTKESSDDSDQSTSDEENDKSSKGTSADFGTTPGDDIKPPNNQNPNSTSIAENVATRNVSFGNFASQWLTRRKSSTLGRSENQLQDTSEPKPASEDDPIMDDIDKASNLKAAKEMDATAGIKESRYAATTGLLPRILRTIKMLFTSGSYFYSHDFDLTHSLANVNLVKGRQLEVKDLDSTVC